MGRKRKCGLYKPVSAKSGHWHRQFASRSEIKTPQLCLPRGSGNLDAIEGTDHGEWVAPNNFQNIKSHDPIGVALIQINAVRLLWASIYSMLKVQWSPDKWLPVSIAPFDTDLEVAVLDRQGAHALLFPSRRTKMGWADATTQKRLDIEPTHWRKWVENRG